MKAANNNNLCPICQARASLDHHPFCSGRCQDVDLGRWFSGRYAIPTNETPTDTTHDEEFDQ
jgi:uncharacterized protein